MIYIFIIIFALVSVGFSIYILDKSSISNENQKQLYLAIERMKTCNETGICNMSIPDLNGLTDIKNKKEASLYNLGLVKLSTHSIFEIGRFQRKSDMLEKDMMELLESGKINEKTSILFKYELELIGRILKRAIEIPDKAHDSLITIMSIHDMQQVCVGIRERLEKLIPVEINMTDKKYGNFLESTYTSISNDMLNLKKE